MNVNKGDKGDKGDTGARGPQGPQGESALVWLAEEQVRRLISAKSVPRWWSYALTVGLAVLIIGAVVIGINSYHNRQLTRTVQQGAISQCEAGNQSRAANVQVWNHVLGAILLGPDVTPATVKWVHDTEAYIAQVEAPRDCQAVYGN